MLLGPASSRRQQDSGATGAQPFCQHCGKAIGADAGHPGLWSGIVLSPDVPSGQAAGEMHPPTWASSISVIKPVACLGGGEAGVSLQPFTPPSILRKISRPG